MPSPWTSTLSDLTRLFLRVEQIKESVKNIMNKSSKTDWEALEAMGDAEINYSDIPPLTDEFFQRAKVWRPQPQVTVAMKIDADILEWFKSENEDWEAQIQTALRLYVETHKLYMPTKA